MKKKSQLGIIIGVIMLSLSGCCFRHEWREADCDDPKTCADCGETEGVANI